LGDFNKLGIATSPQKLNRKIIVERQEKDLHIWSYWEDRGDLASWLIFCGMDTSSQII
jgi:hypothetical protein